MTSATRLLVLFAACVWLATPVFASDTKLPPLSDICKPPKYPERAMDAAEEGLSVLGFLVRADGTVVETAILNSSGSRALDLAALRALSRCTFERSVNVDSNVDVWVRIIYSYSLYDDPERLGAKKIAALSASKGNISGRYHLGLLLLETAKTVEDRVAAISMINSAAELGHPHAQYEMGRHHEIGDLFVGNLDEAMRWYQKSAAQGDPLAKQRLTLRILPK